MTNILPESRYNYSAYTLFAAQGNLVASQVRKGYVQRDRQFLVERRVHNDVVDDFDLLSQRSRRSRDPKRTSGVQRGQIAARSCRLRKMKKVQK